MTNAVQGAPGTTPGPWIVGEYNEMGGYDAMTGGITVGPITLDGYDYGQDCNDDCGHTTPPARMMADAHQIGASPLMYAALEACVAALSEGAATDVDEKAYQAASAALAAARGDVA